MRLFGYHIPGTRDLQKENEQLRERIAMLEKEAQLQDETEKSLRQANHQLRMDLRETNKMVDEWMSHYDELQRDLQREKQKVVEMKMEMGKRGIELDPLQQMRELRSEQLRPEKGQTADPKPTLAREALERLAQDGNGDSPKAKKGQEVEQTRKPREKAKGMEVSL